MSEHPLRALLTALRAADVAIVIGEEGELELVGPPLGARGRRLVDEHRALLTHIAVGRGTGHAPAFCSCGEMSMLSIVNSSGTSRWAPSAGWPRCPFCGRTGTRVIHPEDRLEVRRVRPIGVPTIGRWREHHYAVADAIAALEL